MLSMTQMTYYGAQEGLHNHSKLKMIVSNDYYLIEQSMWLSKDKNDKEDHILKYYEMIKYDGT